MGKQQLSTIDVAAEVACLRQRVLGKGLINVFDINPKTYILKLGTSGETGEKVFLVLESGSRLHTTQYERSHGQFPSNFNLKLRKHIRNRRLNDIRQLGLDRIVDFTFGQEERAVHLILEMYAQGNIVLTDHNYQVLTLLRTHTDSNHDYVLMPKRPYPVQHIRMPRALMESDIVQCFFKTNEQRTLKSIVSELLPFGPACAEHVLLSAGFTPSMLFPVDKRLPEADMDDEQKQFLQGELLVRLRHEIRSLEQWFRTCNTQSPAGYILTKENTSVAGNSAEEQSKEAYVEFEPFLLCQHKHRTHITFDSFDAALDEFFSKKEGQKMTNAEAAVRASAEARLLKTKQDLERRAITLHEEAEREDVQGQLIEYNLTAVDDALSAVNHVLATGMNWDDVQTLIENEAEQGNPVASRIHSLHLEQNSATLLLSTDGLFGPAADEPKEMKVVVDLGIGAAANARQHFERRKKLASKEQKTHEANALAIEAAERKIQGEMKRSMPSASMHQLRKAFWFEKFYWFITTENYLVISGKDAQQNELLIDTRKEDIYVHADLHGASTTIIKNYRPGIVVPPMSLQQAGNACVCRSKAWESKQITSAWWVYSEQVSKTAPSGEYLTTGSFMIRGKKNFLPPVTLTFGIGFMFKLEESSMERHKGERAAKIEEPLIKDIRIDAEQESSVDVAPVLTHEQQKSLIEAFLDESADRLSTEFEKSVQLEQPTMSIRSEFANREDNAAGQSKRHGNKGSKKSKRNKHELETASKSNTSQQKTTESTSGQKGKKKGKRGGRDEEDLVLMTELLQSTGEKKTKQQRREQRKQKKAEKRAASVSKNNPGKHVTREEIQETIAKATETPFAVEEESSGRSEVSEEAELFSSYADLGLDEANEEISTDLAEIRQLNSITGIPYPDDTLLFAVPVCGPYDALVNFKYKVKLLPGTLKKGKGGKQARELLIHTTDLSQRDAELVKNVPEPEVTNVMLGLVKLSMPGMQKIKQNQKTAKKRKN